MLILGDWVSAWNLHFVQDRSTVLCILKALVGFEFCSAVLVVAFCLLAEECCNELLMGV